MVLLGGTAIKAGPGVSITQDSPSSFTLGADPAAGAMNRKPADVPTVVLGDGDQILCMEYYETSGILEVGSGADLYVLGWR